jgi:hypothetical protein
VLALFCTGFHSPLPCGEIMTKFSQLACAMMLGAAVTGQRKLKLTISKTTVLPEEKLLRAGYSSVLALMMLGVRLSRPWPSIGLESEFRIKILPFSTKTWRPVSVRSYCFDRSVMDNQREWIHLFGRMRTDLDSLPYSLLFSRCSSKDLIHGPDRRWRIPVTLLPQDSNTVPLPAASRSRSV